MIAFFALIYTVLDIYQLLVVVYVIMSWLVGFRVLDTRNRFVQIVWDFLVRITDPVLNLFRRFIPTISGIDLSAVLLILAIMFLQRLLVEFFGPGVMHL